MKKKVLPIAVNLYYSFSIAIFFVTRFRSTKNCFTLRRQKYTFETQKYKVKKDEVIRRAKVPLRESVDGAPQPSAQRSLEGTPMKCMIE